ncbi:MAG: type II toxin-antitoxin system VapC family toxin [Sphingobacteriia bacterium]|nr:MAG: type II toxin-antitoxin system VapC family toxin [Sphingobacteriia bacterium]
MNGKEIFVDTNILLYLLNGNDTIENLLQGKTILISFITELELIGFKKLTPHEEIEIQQLLNECSIIHLNNAIKSCYVELRKKYNLKLADTIIAASAMQSQLPLFTADKQFRTIKELNMLSYES